MSYIKSLELHWAMLSAVTTIIIYVYMKYYKVKCPWKSN